MNKRYLPTTFFLVSALAGAVIAQPVEKNGLPCAQELCIGDGLEELRGIKWIKAQSAQDFETKAQMSKIDAVFNWYIDTPPARVKKGRQLLDALSYVKADPNVVSKLGLYLTYSRFDSAVLNQLSEIKTTCARLELVGRFNSENGFPTTVNINLIPSPDGGEQKWKVTRISRFFPENMTKEQAVALNKVFYETYRDFPTGGNTKGAWAKLESPMPSALMGQTATTMTLYGYKLLDQQNTSNFLKHPECGGYKGPITLN